MAAVDSNPAPTRLRVSVPPVRPMYIGVGADAAFGLFHAGATGVRAGAPVLLLGPFGNADSCSYRPRREWAQRLAAAGHPTLRLDLPGAGDSAGGPRDPERVAAWTAAAADAARWLAATTGHRPTVIGIGLGGFVGWLAASAGAPIDDLVLWATPGRGRALVRELKMLSRVEAAAEAGADALSAGVPEGALVAAGHLMSAETIADLSAIDLADRPLPDADGTRRVLLLGRDGVEPDRRLVDAAKACAEVTVQDGAGYGAMLLQPSDALTPDSTIVAVEAWLDAVPATAADGIEAPPSDTRVELDVEGKAVEERPFPVRAGGLTQLGVLTVPGSGQPVADTCLVLVNSGALRRVGPNRMWLELARRWAARGLPVLRVDLARVDDLDGTPEPTERIGFYDLHAHYHQDLGVQLEAVLRALDNTVKPERFIVVGLCSGAYWTFRALQEDPRVAAGILVNPALFFGGWTAAVAREREALRGVRDPTLWRKALTGGIEPARLRQMGSIVAGAALTKLREAPKRLRERSAGTPLEQTLARFVAAGQQLTILFTPDEPFRDELRESGDLARLRDTPGVEVTTLGDLPRAHTLEPLVLQTETHAHLDAAIERELRRHVDGSGPASDRPLRLLHVTESLASGVLGVVSALTERLAAAGHEVVVAHGERPETPDARSVLAPDVRVVALPWRRRTPLAQLRAAVALRRLVTELSPDVVHLHSTFAGFVGALAVPRRIPRVYTPHGYSFLRTSEGWAARNVYRAVEWAIARRVDVLGAVSRSEALQAAQAVRAPRVKVVSNGLPELDAGRLPVVPDRPEVLVAALGRIGPARQPEAAARILSRVAAAADRVAVEWIGGGGDGEDEPGLAALVAAGVPVTGWLDAEAARDELARATVLLHWSAWDAQPLAVLEAMARDVVVVASDLPANRELLGDEQVRATEDDAVALILDVLADEDLRDRLLDAQRARREHYGADRMVADWRAVYRSLVVAKPFRIPT